MRHVSTPGKVTSDYARAHLGQVAGFVLAQEVHDDLLQARAISDAPRAAPVAVQLDVPRQQL